MIIIAEIGINHNGSIDLAHELIRQARMRMGPVALRWDEPPFEWIERQYYSVRRRFHGGPFAELNVGVRLAPEGALRAGRVGLDVRCTARRISCPDQLARGTLSRQRDRDERATTKDTKDTKDQSIIQGQWVIAYSTTLTPTA